MSNCLLFYISQVLNQPQGDMSLRAVDSTCVQLCVNHANNAQLQGSVHFHAVLHVWYMLLEGYPFKSLAITNTNKICGKHIENICWAVKNTFSFESVHNLRQGGGDLYQAARKIKRGPASWTLKIQHAPQILRPGDRRFLFEGTSYLKTLFPPLDLENQTWPPPHDGSTQNT